MYRTERNGRDIDLICYFPRNLNGLQSCAEWGIFLHKIQAFLCRNAANIKCNLYPPAALTNISTLLWMLIPSNILVSGCFSKAVESGISLDVADAYIEPGPPGHRRETGPAR
ncbi:MAG: hypothetical protein R8G34_19900 [Paracoccaceae bacterium]|nr:hypothetical protein [Paracoccaceae bacterium]